MPGRTSSPGATITSKAVCSPGASSSAPRSASVTHGRIGGATSAMPLIVPIPSLVSVIRSLSSPPGLTPSSRRLGAIRGAGVAGRSVKRIRPVSAAPSSVVTSIEKLAVSGASSGIVTVSVTGTFAPGWSTPGALWVSDAVTLSAGSSSTSAIPGFVSGSSPRFATVNVFV